MRCPENDLKSLFKASIGKPDLEVREVQGSREGRFLPVPRDHLSNVAFRNKKVVYHAKRLCLFLLRINMQNIINI